MMPSRRFALSFLAYLAIIAALSLGADAAPGRLDGSFGSGGIALASLGTDGTSRANAIRVLPDGGILAAGFAPTGVPLVNGFLVAKFTANGDPDLSFGSGTGRATVAFGVSAEALAMAVDANGGIVVVGVAGDIFGNLAIAKLRPDGSLDTSFANGGRFYTSVGSFAPGLSGYGGRGNAVDFTPQGGFVVAGQTTSTFSTAFPFVARFNANGTGDTTFGQLGYALSPIGGNSSSYNAVRVLADGRMYFGGRHYLNSASSFIVARLSATGNLDASGFPTYLSPDIPSGEGALSLLVQPDGKVVAGGVLSGANGIVVRLLADGSLDPGFGIQGVAPAPQPPGAPGLKSVRALVRDSAGRLVAAGASSTSPAVPAAYRIGTTGVADLSFGDTNGVFAGPAAATGAAAGGAFAVDIDAQGRAVLAVAREGRFAVMRLSGDETRDFDGDGIPDDVEVVEGHAGRAKDNDVFTNARLFAMQQYRDFLAREGEASGVSFWTSQMNAGTQTRAQMVEAFFNSAEFQGVIAPVARLYFAYFLRIPDYDGLNHWIGQARAGGSLETISNAFATSAEFVGRYGSLSNEQFVTLVYQNVLGRSPDAAGLAHWAGQLSAGLARGQLMAQFSESAEYQALIASEVYVTMMYYGMLRRSPEQAGFDFWVGYKDAGNSGIALISGFLAAAEYRQRFLP